MASPPIVQVSDTKKEKEYRDIEECLRNIENLFEDEEEIVVEEVVVAEKEEVAKNEKEKEEDFVENIITIPESVGANIDNLEQTGARSVKVAEVTSEEQCNSLAIVSYTGPLQVASPTQTAADNARVELGIEEQSKDCTKPKEKKRKCSKDKK
ncbi:hypothetical protein PVK06_020337 [Gossypium arboreum]|uniref:Uncharacterized protein n=1 Tax=Gossypium arboreum TaxID=29729 RepID=A0ABR0PM91_GOSAR|nr:hypothetical protein PVK06_020337 [Gossypium arboreum]